MNTLVNWKGFVAKLAAIAMLLNRYCHCNRPEVKVLSNDLSWDLDSEPVLNAGDLFVFLP